jgi:hypothetical protein
MIASGGQGFDGGNVLRNGGAGTVYLKDNARAYADLTIDNRNMSSRENSTVLASLGRGTISIITSTSMTGTAVNWIPSAFVGAKINPDVNQQHVFQVTDNTVDTVFIDPVGGNLNSVAVVGDTYSGVFALNTLQILGKAQVYCNEQFTIASELFIDNALLVTNEIYAGTVTKINGGTHIHPGL